MTDKQTNETRNFILETEERLYVKGRMDDIKKRIWKESAYVCVGMMACHVVENIYIHGRRIHAFGQDGMSDVHSTDIPTHVGSEE